MTRNALAALATLAVLAVASPRPTLAADKGREADEKVLLELENAWTVAVRARDLAKLSEILAEDWVGNGPFGTFTRAQSLADLKSGDSKIESVSAPHDMKVRFFGDVAIVTGASEEKSSWKGKDTSGNWVWTDVWVKRKGKWQAVASQSSLLAPK
jgi:ketosteroid isomerase-like protein